MQTAEAAFAEVEESFDTLRRAVESRDYGLFDGLLLRQRELLRSLPLSDLRTRTLTLRGHQLTEWAIIMVKIQRSGYIRSHADILNSKHLDCNYASARPKRADVLSVHA